MSYYNNEACLVSYSLENKREPSNSLYLARDDEIEESNEFSELFEAAGQCIGTDSTNSSAKGDFNKTRWNHKEECGQSFPGSTDVDSEDDYFESQVEALDELSELFGDESPRSSQENRSTIFSRPSNPVVGDTQFCIPRCSAPAPSGFSQREARLEVTEMKFSSSFSSKKQDLNMSNYIKPSGPIFRPVARINSNLTTSASGSF